MRGFWQGQDKGLRASMTPLQLEQPGAEQRLRTPSPTPTRATLPSEGSVRSPRLDLPTPAPRLCRSSLVELSRVSVICGAEPTKPETGPHGDPRSHSIWQERTLRTIYFASSILPERGVGSTDDGFIHCSTQRSKSVSRLSWRSFWGSFLQTFAPG